MDRKSFRIIVDVDGIVTDTLSYWLDVIYDCTGYRATPEDIKVWELHKNLALMQIPPRIIYDRLQDKGFILSLPEIPGAVEYCKRLQEDGHQVHFVTARHGLQSMPETILWFNQHMPWVNVETQVNFLYDKENFADADFIIDDKASTLVKYLNRWPNSTACTFIYAYNRHLLDMDIVFFDKDDKGWEKLYTFIDARSKDATAKPVGAL